jgi:hypothetical protein
MQYGIKAFLYLVTDYMNSAGGKGSTPAKKTASAK